jgi:hypothetical protein
MPVSKSKRKKKRHPQPPVRETPRRRYSAGG